MTTALAVEAQSVIDDFPGLTVDSNFACPGCVAKHDARPTIWPLDEVAKMPKRCEKCGEKIEVQAIPLNREKVAAMTLMLDTSPLDMPELRFSSDKVRFGRPLEAALGLPKLLGLADADKVEELRAAGEMAICDEIFAGSTDERDEHDGAERDERRAAEACAPPGDSTARRG